MNMYSCNSCSLPHCSCSKKECFESMAGLFKMMSEKNRLQLMCRLHQKEHCVCELTPYVELSQSLISHHLADLRQAELVVDKRRGRRVYYQLTDLGKHMMDILESIQLSK